MTKEPPVSENPKMRSHRAPTWRYTAYTAATISMPAKNSSTPGVMPELMTGIPLPAWAMPPCTALKI